jgi:DHA1 family inner membrane transport protein
MLLSLMGVFVAGNVVVALAPSMGVLLVGRALAALGQGAFFGIGSVVASELVRPELRSRAISTVFAGVNIANILGAPLGTWIGQQFGWRVTIAVIATLGLIGLLALAAFLPRFGRPEVSLRDELVAFRSGRVWLNLVVGMLTMAGLFTMFSFVAPLVTEVARLPVAAVGPVLVGFGIGITAGNLIGGRLADRAPVVAMLTPAAGLTVCLVLLGLSAGHAVPVVVLLIASGAAGFSVIPASLGQMVRLAPHAPTMVASAAGSAGNIGIAVGAQIGGAVIGAGGGFVGPVWAAAVPAGLGVVAATAMLLAERRSPVVSAA